MIDPITEQILFEEAGFAALKTVTDKIEKSLKKGDIKSVERISNKLPSANLNQVKMRASKKFPKFRQKYDEVKRIIKNSKILDPSIYEPASVAVAIVAASTDMKVSEVLSRGEKGIPQGKILSLLIPGIGFVGPILKLAFFIIALISIFSIAGIGLGAAASAAWKAGGFLLSMLSNSISAISKIALVQTGHTPDLGAAVKSSLGIDTSMFSSTPGPIFTGGFGAFKTKK
jgi:hypothetical protein